METMKIANTVFSESCLVTANMKIKNSSGSDERSEIKINNTSRRGNENERQQTDFILYQVRYKRCCIAAIEWVVSCVCPIRRVAQLILNSRFGCCAPMNAVSVLVVLFYGFRIKRDTSTAVICTCKLCLTQTYLYTQSRALIHTTNTG